MNTGKVTVQDCIEKYEKDGETAIINDGKVVCFIKENIPATDRKSEQG